MAHLSILRPTPTRQRLWPGLAGGLAGAGLGFALTSRLAVVPATLLSALLLAGGAELQRHLRDAGRWWLVVGGACGTLTGTACVLGSALQEAGVEAHRPERALTVAVLAGAGLIAGQRLGLEAPPSRRQPRELLRSASTLTTGVFATLVTVAYINLGLDGARTLSSRLSTGLTILVLSLVGPGWLSHRLSEEIRQSAGRRSRRRSHDGGGSKSF